MTMLDSEPISVPGWRIEQRFPNLTYPLGRVCENEQCSTRLSRYNPDALCALHMLQSRCTFRSTDYLSARR